MKKLFLSFLLIFSSCGDEFTQQFELGKLRVIAVVASKPEVNSTEAVGGVTLTPLISYVDGAGATINYTWVACPDPGIDVGAEISCDSATASLKLSSGGTLTYNTSTLSGSYYTGNADTISITIPPAAFTYLGTLDSKIQTNGLNYIVLITYTDPNNNSTTTALKTIKMSTKATADLNANPTLGDILFDSATLSSFPTSEGKMTASSLSTAETYDYVTSNGNETLTEEMYLSWYASSGEFVFNRTTSNEPNPYTPKGSGGVFVMVYRDGRGGVAAKVEVP